MANFKVVYLKSVKEATQKGFLIYRKRGLANQFIEAARIIDDGLRTKPREFGDPCCSYPYLQLDVFVRAVAPLIIYYGVHQTETTVFVNHLEILD